MLCNLCVLECFGLWCFWSSNNNNWTKQQQQLNKNNTIIIIINDNNNGDCENIKGFWLECWEPLFVVRHVRMFPSSSTQKLSFPIGWESNECILLLLLIIFLSHYCVIKKVCVCVCVCVCFFFSSFFVSQKWKYFLRSKIYIENNMSF